MACWLAAHGTVSAIPDRWEKSGNAAARGRNRWFKTVHHSLKFSGSIPTCKGMTGERESPGSDANPPARQLETKAKMIAEGVALAVFGSLYIAGIFAALGTMPTDSAAVILSILFWMSIVSTVLFTFGTLYRAYLPHDRRKPIRDVGEFGVRVMRLLWRGLVVALLIGGQYVLAALMLYGFVLGIAKRVENRRILGEEHKVGFLSRAVHRVVFGVAERLAPVYGPVHRLMTRKVGEVPLIGWLLMIPLTPLFILFAGGWLLYWLLRGLIAIPFLLFDWRREQSDRRDLVKTASANGIVAWFAYAEPHQREHFMGAGGVLHGLGDAVIARDWRAELGEAWRTDSLHGLDALIVRQCKLSNMRDDLPVIVLLQPDGRLYPIRLNRAYRQRRRDGGDLLGTMEETIRERMVALRPSTCSPA